MYNLIFEGNRMKTGVRESASCSNVRRVWGPEKGQFVSEVEEATWENYFFAALAPLVAAALVVFGLGVFVLAAGALVAFLVLERLLV